MCAQPLVSQSTVKGTVAENRHSRCSHALQPKQVLLLGLGNDLLTDDAVGLRIAAGVREQLRDCQNVSVAESSEMGLALLDLIIGFDALLLIDAIQTGQVAPGSIHQFDLAQLKTLPFQSPHFVGIGEVMELGRKLGLKVPARVRVFAIEVQDPFTVSQQMTPPLERAMARLVHEVVDETRKLTERGDSFHRRRERAPLRAVSGKCSIFL